MNTQPLKVGDRIERIASDYTGGRKGTVIEVKEGRARIQWDKKHPRTWIRFADLLPIARAKNETTKGEWVPTPGMKSHSAMRVCENKATGEVWHEYQKR